MFVRHSYLYMFDMHSYLYVLDMHSEKIESDLQSNLITVCLLCILTDTAHFPYVVCFDNIWSAFWIVYF
jgi:hypothetical protein